MVKDFLYQCFQKDPNLRISAKKLAKHPWMIAAQRQIDLSHNQAAQQGPSSRSSQADNVTGSIRGPTSPVTATFNPPVTLQPGDARKAKIIIPKRPKSSHAAVNPIAGSSALAQSTSSQAGPSRTGPQARTNAVGSAAVDLKRRPLTTVYDEAVQRVQEWNEALQGEHMFHVEMKPLHQQWTNNPFSRCSCP